MSYDDYYEEEMNCSDYVVNNNYDIMRSKIINNGTKICITLVLQLVILLLDLAIFIYRAIEQCRSEIRNHKTGNGNPIDNVTQLQTNLASQSA